MSEDIRIGHKIRVIAPDGTTAFKCDDAMKYVLFAVQSDGKGAISTAIDGPVDALKILSTLLGSTVIAPIVRHAVQEEMRRVVEELNPKPKVVVATEAMMPTAPGGHEREVRR